MYMPKYPQGPTASGMGATPYPPMGYQYQPSVSRQQAFQSTFLAPQPSIPADPMFSPEMSAPGMSMYAMSQPIFQTSSPVAHHQLAPAAVPVNAVRKAPSQSVQSPQEAQEQEQAGQADKFKTELCRKFALTGFCRYGDMCQFAHGTNELRALVRHPLYKTSPCKSFEATGTCRYGARCRFIHDEAQTELAILARGVPALNLQITEPSWEEAQAAALDAVQHLVISTGLSPQLLPATTSVHVASGGQRQSSPPRGAQRIPIPDPVSLEKAPKQSTVTSPLNAMQDNGRSLGMSGRSKSEAAEMSRTLSSSKTQTSSSGEVRSISSLIMMNSNGGSNGHNPVSSPTHNQQPRVVGSSGSGGAQPHRVASSVKLVIDEDVFPPANLDARRLPVANSSWVNLSEMAQTPTPGQPPSPTRAYGRSGQSESLKHSYSQPLLGVDTWSPFNDPHLNRPAGSLASLPVIPQQTSPANNNVSNPGALGSGLRSASSNALNSFPNSASSSNLGASAFSRTENQANFRKAASYANHIWFESTEGNEDGGWSSMARARSVDGRLNIFRNLSDQDLAKTAENAQVSRLPAYEEKLGEVGLALSDDEDRGTDDGRGHDTEEDDTGFSVGKF